MDTSTCEWYTLCENTAIGHVMHPVLGPVPVCQRCKEKHEMVLMTADELR